MAETMLVLSLFPGIGLLDMAFEEEGFCVVRGPDLLWGGDVKRFHPPVGKFTGVIGGPPCKGESKLAYLNGDAGRTLRDEFMRVWAEAEAHWYLMEAVQHHQQLAIPDDKQRRTITNWTTFPKVAKLNNRWLGHEQHRKRYFHSNLDLAPHIELAALEHPEWKYAVLAGHGGGVGSVQRRMAKYSLADACRLQGLAETFADGLPFTRQWKYEVIGNGVPLPMGRAIARAVKQAAMSHMTAQKESERKPLSGPIERE